LCQEHWHICPSKRGFAAELAFSDAWDNSPSIVDPHGPLAKVAQFSGLSAVEEIGLLKAQVEDVSRVCKTVALDNFSQKITVQAKGEVIAQLKDLISSNV
jgi:osomolarity two-component system sensor histidine kinase NIK1